MRRGRPDPRRGRLNLLLLGGTIIVGLAIAGLAVMARSSLPAEQVERESTTDNESSPAKTSQAQASSFGRSPAGPQPVAPVTQAATPQNNPAVRLQLAIGAAHANAADERTAIVEALEGAGPCTESWCGDAVTTLDAWLANAKQGTSPDLEATPISCTAAGCWTLVGLRTVQEHAEAIMRVQSSGEGWPGMAILGGADTSQGDTVTSIWVLARPEANE